MEAVQAYRTNDGKLCATYEEAERHERTRAAYDSLNVLIGHTVPYMDNKETVKSFITEHHTELLPILLSLGGVNLRPPTADEREELAHCLMKSPETAGSFDDEKQCLEHMEYVACFPSYKTDGIGFSGTLFLIVWGGGPNMVTVISRLNTPDGGYAVEAHADMPLAKK